jgi:protein-S-isoprenylcysteine O-methyltransferase Ste14
MPFPPPLTVTLFGVGGAVLEWLWPTAFSVGRGVAWAGVALVSAGFVLVLLAITSLRQAGASPDPRVAVPALARRGVYRFPIYLGMLLALLGAGLWLDSVWIAAGALPAWAILQRTIVAREEAYLAARFPKEYADYARRVRRWF